VLVRLLHSSNTETHETYNKIIICQPNDLGTDSIFEQNAATRARVHTVTMFWCFTILYGFRIRLDKIIEFVKRNMCLIVLSYYFTIHSIYTFTNFQDIKLKCNMCKKNIITKKNVFFFT